MNRLSAIGIIIFTLLSGIVSVSAETATGQEVIPIPEFPTVAILIAFLIGIIGAVLFLVSTKEN